MLGTPYFDEMTLHLENGKTVSIKARNNSEENCYIQQLLLNGAPYSKNYITHTDLMNGATFIYDLGEKPNTHRGTADTDAPYSFSKEKALKGKK